MMGVLVEFTIEEAEAMLRRYDDSDFHDPHAAAGRSRLERAVNIERGRGGYHERQPEPQMEKAA
jgi:hypothetical protein